MSFQRCEVPVDGREIVLADSQQGAQNQSEMTRWLTSELILRLAHCHENDTIFEMALWQDAEKARQRRARRDRRVFFLRFPAISAGSALNVGFFSRLLGNWFDRSHHQSAISNQQSAIAIH
jgi:hypothetical protein